MLGLRVLIHDVTKHFIYTLILVALTSVVTFFLVSKVIDQKIMPNLQEGLYTERGSPYDNRTVDNATESALVIFHGPRDKKRIALTFDAEMTDGM